MIKKSFVALVSVLLLVGAGCGAAAPSNSVVDEPVEQPTEQPSTAPQEPPAPAPSPTASDSVNTYAMSDVATHKNAVSCWSVIRGDVYDLTAWIGQHPGGPGRILGICGIDATAAFDAQHKGKGRPEAALVTFKIGALKQ